LLAASMIAGLQVVDPGQVAATGNVVLRIAEAQAEMEQGELRLRGENFTRRNRDQVFVSLAGELLAVVSVSETEILALLPRESSPERTGWSWFARGDPRCGRDGPDPRGGGPGRPGRRAG
jgi:hypothetical protein